MLTKFYSPEGEGIVTGPTSWDNIAQMFPNEVGPVTETAQSNDTTSVDTTATAAENTTTEVVEQPQAEATTQQPAAETQQVAEVPQPIQEIIPAKSWQELIKEADRTDVLKQVGIPDPLVELIQFYETHGNLDAYYDARVKNWDTVPAEDLLRQQLRSEYSALSDTDFDLLYQEEMESRFKQADHFTDKEQQIGRLRLQNEAAKIREGKKAEQAKYQLPTVDKTAAQQSAEQAALARQADEQAQLRKIADDIKASPLLQKLQQDKRLVINAGEHALNLTVDATTLTEASLNVNKIFEGAVDDRGHITPDWAEFLAFRSNPQGFKKALIDLGKSLGAKAVVTEQVNPSAQQPTPASPPAQTLHNSQWKQVNPLDFFRS